MMVVKFQQILVAVNLSADRWKMKYRGWSAILALVSLFVIRVLLFLVSDIGYQMDILRLAQTL